MIILMLAFIVGTFFLFSPMWFDYSRLGNTQRHVDLMAEDEGDE